MSKKLSSFGVCVLLVGLATIMAGCAVGPDYRIPEMETPDAWQNAAAQDVQSETPIIKNWWSVFNDAYLDSLIIQAEISNLDLDMAVSRIREARAYHRIAGGDSWPQVGASGSLNRAETPDFYWPGGENPASNWEFGLGASWEIDVWGKNRRARESTGAALQSSIEDYRDVQVSMYAEVAFVYLKIRTLQMRLDFARENLESQRSTLDVVVAREEAGLAPLLDVSQARSNLANTEATIPSMVSSLEEAMNSLAILLGQNPGSLDEELRVHAGLPTPSMDLTLILPAELLRRRPDVRRSERSLASQSARIGVATAELYPSFSLGGSMVLKAPEFGNLSESGAFGWSFGPELKWNLFSGGKISSQIDVEEARTEQLLLTYEKTVLLALAEVENSLVALRQEERRRDLLKTAAESAQKSVELVETQYVSGLTDFQNYLDSQRVLFSQMDQLAVSKGIVLNNLINLNRALGGGWSLDDPDPDLPVEPVSSATAESTTAEEEG
ncbi:MAG: efflux transporter outer membrane subunit [bacterium]|nr:efflux transporter outer membrane subunit [bacterium]